MLDAEMAALQQVARMEREALERVQRERRCEWVGGGVHMSHTQTAAHNAGERCHCWAGQGCRCGA
jgi:hypothetical protein